MFKSELQEELLRHRNGIIIPENGEFVQSILQKIELLDFVCKSFRILSFTRVKGDSYPFTVSLIL